jgi:hypothetical protein
MQLCKHPSSAMLAIPSAGVQLAHFSTLRGACGGACSRYWQPAIANSDCMWVTDSYTVLTALQLHHGRVLHHPVRRGPNSSHILWRQLHPQHIPHQGAGSTSACPCPEQHTLSRC